MRLQNKPRSGAGRPGAWSPLGTPGVSQLQKEGPIRTQEALPIQFRSEEPGAVVRVAQEEDRLGVHLVGEEELGEHGPRLQFHRYLVFSGVPLHVLVLDDGSNEGSDVEVVDSPQLDRKSTRLNSSHYS